MTFEMTESNRTIKIYNLSSSTNEFIGKGDAFIPANTGLPAYSTDIAPPDIADGFVAIFDSQSGEWSVVEDHRGETVYNILTGQAIIMNQLGNLPDDVVSIAPNGDFVKWNGNEWVYDAEAEKNMQVTQAIQQKENLILLSTSKIAPLQDAVDLEIATDDESKSLVEWRKYRVLLNRVDPQKAPDIEWPAQP